MCTANLLSADNVQNSIISVEDIFSLSRVSGKHAIRMHEALNLLNLTHITLKLKNRIFSTKFIDYLCHLFGGDVLRFHFIRPMK